MGPLERKVDRTATSSRIYETLTTKDGEKKLRREEHNRRIRRRMPMIESLKEMEDLPVDEQEAFTVERTTSFSTQAAAENAMEVRLTDQEILRLLTLHGARGYGGIKEMSRPSSEKEGQAQQGARSYIDQFLRVDNKSAIPDVLRKDNVFLVRNALLYTGAPVIMRDTDKDLAGAWPGRVQALRKMKLKHVARNEVQLIIDEDEEEKDKTGAIDTSASDTSFTMAEISGMAEGQVDRRVTPTGATSILVNRPEPKNNTKGDGLFGELLAKDSMRSAMKQEGTSGSTKLFLEEERRRVKEDHTKERK